MSVLIAPSVLSFDLSDCQRDVAALAGQGADWIHLDVMDGRFVPPISFGDAFAKSLRSVSELPFEVHLMTEAPETQFAAFMAAGCTRVIFHAEATPQAHRLCQWLRSEGVQAGVALNPGTPVQVLAPLRDVLDLALIMTVNPGWGGQVLIESCLEKVREVRAMAPDLVIEVDGGIDAVTASRAVAAGANVLVVGSYLAKHPDREAAIAQVRRSCD